MASQLYPLLQSQFADNEWVHGWGQHNIYSFKALVTTNPTNDLELPKDMISV